MMNMLAMHTGREMANRGKVLVISGSPSPRSRTAMVGSHVGKCLRQRGFSIEELLVRQLPAEALMHADFNNNEICRAIGSVEAADGIVLCTPTYKAAYSGLLKSFLDMLPQFGLAEKAVLPLATGGSKAHVLALDYALRPVLHSMGARHVVQSHFLLDREVAVGEDGELTIAQSTLPQLQTAIAAFESALACSVDAVMVQS